MSKKTTNEDKKGKNPVLIMTNRHDTSLVKEGEKYVAVEWDNRWQGGTPEQIKSLLKEMFSTLKK